MTLYVIIVGLMATGRALLAEGLIALGSRAGAGAGREPSAVLAGAGRGAGGSTLMACPSGRKSTKAANQSIVAYIAAL